VYGPGVHIATFLEEPRGVTFLLEDVEGRCAEIVRAYHRDDGGDGFAISDAKALIDEFIETRKTLTKAIDSGKEWRNTSNG
jgi:hypothetical protein